MRRVRVPDALGDDVDALVGVEQQAARLREPVHVGELVSFLASVNYTGSTSMEIGIKVVTENIRAQTKRHANSCFFTMVAMDDVTRKPVAVPPLVPVTPDQQRRFEAAKVRRQLRQEFGARLRALTDRAA